MKGNRGGNGGSGIVIIRYLKTLGSSTFNGVQVTPLNSIVLSADAADLSSAEVLIVAGGGGGGMDMGGGGGGGGVLYYKAYPVKLNTAYDVVIGGGGAGSPGTYGADPAPGSTGGNSSFSGTTALGGGGGGSGHWRESTYTGTRQGQPGGCGGGDSPSYGHNRLVGGGGGTKGQGFGGGGGPWYAQYNAGGGGGAGQPGQSGPDTYGGHGGRGFASDITGSTLYYGGGGGGNGHSYIGGAGGLGGGGGGSSYSTTGGAGGGSSTNSGANGSSGSNTTGGAGGANSGGGGGGSSHWVSVGGNGGSGIVIVRYSGSAKGTGGTISTSGGYTTHTFTSSGTFTPTSYLDLTDNSQLQHRTFLGNGAYYTNGYVEKAGDNDAYLEVPNQNFTWLTDLTMECVFQVAGTHQNYHGTLMSSGDWNVNHWAFTVNQDNGSVQLRRPYLGYSYSFSVNTWYHVIWTRSGTNNTVYVNGNSIGSQTGSDGIPLLSNATNTMIGRETYAGGYFNLNGRIAIAKIYNSALTANEVKQHFQAVRGRFGI
jgi:hypothetical protein